MMQQSAPLGSLLMFQPVRNGWYTTGLCCHPKGRNLNKLQIQPTGTSEVQQKQCRVLHQYLLGADHKESCLAPEELRVPVGTKVNMRLHCALVVAKAGGILGCIRRGVGSS